MTFTVRLTTYNITWGWGSWGMSMSMVTYGTLNTYVLCHSTLCARIRIHVCAYMVLYAFISFIRRQTCIQSGRSTIIRTSEDRKTLHSSFSALFSLSLCAVRWSPSLCIVSVFSVNATSQSTYMKLLLDFMIWH